MLQILEIRQIPKKLRKHVLRSKIEMHTLKICFQNLHFPTSSSSSPPELSPPPVIDKIMAFIRILLFIVLAAMLLASTQSLSWIFGIAPLLTVILFFHLSG